MVPAYVDYRRYGKMSTENGFHPHELQLDDWRDGKFGSGGLDAFFFSGAGDSNDSGRHLSR